jgi:hypothetical protein
VEVLCEFVDVAIVKVPKEVVEGIGELVSALEHPRLLPALAWFSLLETEDCVEAVRQAHY